MPSLSDVVRGVMALGLSMVALFAGTEVRGEAGAKAGHLVICGGGGLPDPVRARFVELAGGPRARIVVVPTASEDADAKGRELEEFLEPWKKREVASVTLLHTRSRAEADKAEFAARLDESDGVWFSGGDQSRVTEAYLGTAFESGLRRLLARGGVIGGTSAGAAIMSRVMITGGAEKATVGVGFGFLPDVVVDQHALRRSRLNRLVGVLTEHPEVAAGVAIDEGTALIVDLGAKRWKVDGASYVVVLRHVKEAPPPLRIDVFHAGEEGDLGTWRVQAR
ncbi:cyanophycinase [Paludisphaera mucosa]|uniref:Cyanophycinase n=1 Tax=Paludisphaera mucosa TaxID=3030827 RepID=A0ABT6F785_9BACT|nr:cyanophycinase [Paludisphaera mucosa]MDG3003436.1 cyanophycinase [Paludisphaera mucosa]